MKSRRSISRKTTRRKFVAGMAAGAVVAPVLFRAGEGHAAQADLAAAIRGITKGAAPREGRVRVDAPSLAETGTAVQVAIKVESPMTAQDRVTAIHILLEHNPEPDAAHFVLGPRCGKAE
ncbi:MAG: thiosulfate oxidation carrier protein SoxY, partial [Alphaproteobacteria bacterium]